MPASYDKRSAIAVLPRVRHGQVKSAELRAWLARSELVDVGRTPELLPWILGGLGVAIPDHGLGALRLWGQTGERPSAWVAAADPVYLEPRLDHLCVHAQGRARMPPSDLGPLVEHLQATIGDGSPYGFARVDSLAYLCGDDRLASASLSPAAVDGQTPNDHLPTGEGADRHRALLSEIEMALHDHPVNLERQQRGLPPINSLWIWGGGVAPDATGDPYPPLFADDPLLRGYWRCNDAIEAPWPGDMLNCLDAADDGFVAVTPDANDGESLDRWLSELRDALSSGRLSSLSILFSDGVAAHVRRVDAMRFWRKQNPLLEVPASAS